MSKRYFNALSIIGLILAYTFLVLTVHAQDETSEEDILLLVPEIQAPEEAVTAIQVNWEISGMTSAIRHGYFAVAGTLADNLLQRKLSPGQREIILNSQLHVALVLGDLTKAQSTLATLESEAIPVDPLLRIMEFFFSGDLDAARDLIGSFPLQQRSPSERAWFRLIEALLLSREGELEAANQAFLLAERTAPSSLLRDHFEIIRLREDLESGNFSEEGISALRESGRSMRGERGGFEAARLLAIALNRAGNQNEAVDVLNIHLALPGLREFGFRPDFLLLLGTIAGADSTRGQLALRQLISESEGGEDLKVALSLLAQSVSGPSQRDAFLRDIAGWLELPTPHPLTDRLLAYQAYWLLDRGNLVEAENSATLLLDRFPNSSFSLTALRLLARISWSQVPPRYRTAAGYLSRLRQKLTAKDDLLRNGILIADCYFLNEDYASASDAYGAVLGEANQVAARGIFFQRILSEIGADRPELAAQFIDLALQEVRLDLATIWKAEWNLLDYYRRQNRIQGALQRVNQLLDRDSDVTALSPELLLRMKWVEARLSLEAGQPELASTKALSLLEAVGTDVYADVPAQLLSEVESHLLLLTGEALYSTGEKALALSRFSDLRNRFPRSGPAILSYLVESRAESEEDNLVSAQQSLIGLVDRFPSSEYAPIALWEAALNAEQRGLIIHLQEAISILERLVTDYPDHGLVYYARLKQGDLARRLNDFPTALLLYERILSQYPDHPERFRAEMSRADCLMALGSEGSSRYDMATVIYERMCLLPTVPLTVRIEAGFKWAHALRQQRDISGSESVLWLLHERFILDPDRNQTVLLEEAGRYWMSRVLLELGTLQADKGESAAAIEVLEIIPRLQLPGIALANARIEALK